MNNRNAQMTLAIVYKPRHGYPHTWKRSYKREVVTYYVLKGYVDTVRPLTLFMATEDTRWKRNAIKAKQQWRAMEYFYSEPRPASSVQTAEPGYDHHAWCDAQERRWMLEDLNRFERRNGY